MAGVPVLNCMYTSSWHASSVLGSNQTVKVGGVEFSSTCSAAAVSELDRPSLAHSLCAAASIACVVGVTVYSLQVRPPMSCGPIDVTLAPCCSSTCSDELRLPCSVLFDGPLASGISNQCFPPKIWDKLCRPTLSCS